MNKEELIQTAINELKNAYAPYSHFHVAAALLCRDGSVYKGVNIENSSYTPTICAERTAFFKAVSEGKREFETIVICGGMEGRMDDFCYPCGVCRQVMQEFCDPDKFLIILPNSLESYKEYLLKELLPHGFGPACLSQSEVK